MFAALHGNLGVENDKNSWEMDLDGSNSQTHNQMMLRRGCQQSFRMLVIADPVSKCCSNLLRTRADFLQADLPE